MPRPPHIRLALLAGALCAAASLLTSCYGDTAPYDMYADKENLGAGKLNWVGSKLCKTADGKTVKNNAADFCPATSDASKSCDGGREICDVTSSIGNVARIVNIEDNKKYVFSCAKRSDILEDGILYSDTKADTTIKPRKDPWRGCKEAAKKACGSIDQDNFECSNNGSSAELGEDPVSKVSESYYRIAFHNHACPTKYEYRAAESVYETLGSGKTVESIDLLGDANGSGIDGENVYPIDNAYECIRARCNGVITSVLSDKNNCGSCSNECPEDRLCQNGRCIETKTTCPAGQILCNGNCISEQIGALHIASCKENGEFCDPFACEAGYVYLGNIADGCKNIKDVHVKEATLRFSDAGAGCKTTVKCEDGYGNLNQDASDGCETKLSLIHIESAEYDANGNISGIICEAGFGNLNGEVRDGCELSLSDFNIDGIEYDADGKVSKIICSNGYANFDENVLNGCETELSKIRVVSAETDENGNIAITCETGWDDCNNDKTDGCETDINASPLDCGSCGVKCEPNGNEEDHVLASACKNGKCVAQTCTSQAYRPHPSENRCMEAHNSNYDCCGPDDTICYDCTLDKIGSSSGQCYYYDNDASLARCYAEKCLLGYVFTEGEEGKGGTCAPAKCATKDDCSFSAANQHAATNSCSDNECVCKKDGSACKENTPVCHPEEGVCKECAPGANELCKKYKNNDPFVEKYECTEDYNCKITCKTGYGFDFETKKCLKLTVDWCELGDDGKSRKSCSALANAKNIECIQTEADSEAKCVIQSCNAGYFLAADGNACVNLNDNGINADHVRAVKKDSAGKWIVSGCKDGFLPNPERNACNYSCDGDLEKTKSYGYDMTYGAYNNGNRYRGSSVICQMFDIDSEPFKPDGTAEYPYACFTNINKNDRDEKCGNICEENCSDGNKLFCGCLADSKVGAKWRNPFMMCNPISNAGQLIAGKNAWDTINTGNGRYACTCGTSSVVCSPGQRCVPKKDKDGNDLPQETIDAFGQKTSYTAEDAEMYKSWTFECEDP